MVRQAVLLLVLVACSSSSGPADWMARQEDTRTLASLSIPGTHDAGARFEPIAGLAKTQELTIAEQLDAGVRFFDIRCRHYQDGFLIYHGAVDQNQTYADVLATMTGFLDAHPDEALIVSIQEEATPDKNTRSFEATFTSYLDPARWSLATAVPTLGAVRGKLVLLRRFAATGVGGLDATAWPDDSPQPFTIGGQLRVQDAYTVLDNDLKWSRITALVDEARADPDGLLYLNFTSGKREIDGLSNIPVVSDAINPRLDTLLADPANRAAHLGVLVMDHVTPARIAAVLATND
jgi:1-phosphatidylinositol phosphodiesterase